MTVTRRLALIGVGAASAATLLGAGPALAHRLARTETELRIDADGRVSVIHVYHLQDVQSALYKAGLIAGPDLSSLRARAQLANYTQGRFRLYECDAPVNLSIIGAEIEGGHVYVYQEGQLFLPSNTVDRARLTLDASMLRDLLVGQSNSVNVIRNGETRTIEFSGDDGIKEIG